MLLPCLCVCAAVSQRSEALGQYGGTVGVHSISVDPMRPFMFATGGADSIGARPRVLHDAPGALGSHRGAGLRDQSRGWRGSDWSCRAPCCWRCTLQLSTLPPPSLSCPCMCAVRVYDRRMLVKPQLQGQRFSTSRPPSWCCSFVPDHLAANAGQLQVPLTRTHQVGPTPALARRTAFCAGGCTGRRGRGRPALMGGGGALMPRR